MWVNVSCYENLTKCCFFMLMKIIFMSSCQSLPSLFTTGQLVPFLFPRRHKKMCFVFRYAQESILLDDFLQRKKACKYKKIKT